jgi:uncharacterized protein (DUF2249 family)
MDINKSNNNTVCLDVRPIIQSGSDPFSEIMAAVKSLKTDQTLEIINSFEPIPLINKLEKEGFISWTERLENGIVHTYFKKGNAIKDLKETKTPDETSSLSFDEKYKFFIGKMKFIDVRYLEMPEPMSTILEEIELLPKANALLVEHKKVPQFLLPELKARGFEILYNMKAENHLQLLIFKG